MNRRSVLDSLPPALREACSAFEPQFAAWVWQRSGDPELARAALALAVAQAAGHVGVAISADGAVPELPGFAPALAVARLAASDWVAARADRESPRPFVLERGRFYSWRSWQAETRVAAALAARLDATTPAATPARIAMADRLLPPAAAGTPDPAGDQRRALLAAAERSLFTLTGGPGTGKTATVLKLLLLAVLDARPAPLRIGLAAPTGKAAQRLAEAIVLGKAQLLADPTLPPDGRAALAAIPETAATLHRWLGLRGQATLTPGVEDTPTPLAVDLLVIDEASMVDLDLMDRVLAQLAPATRLLLLGDADQLSAVGAGSVLADLVADGRAVGRLHQVFRAGGSLQALAARLRDGDAEAALAALTASGDDALRWRALDAPAHWQSWLAAWVRHPGRALLATLAQDLSSPAAALAALGRWRLLAAVREGPFGVLALNRWLSAWVADQVGARGDTWFPGRVVLIIRNQPALGLYNGDVGVCLRESGPDSDGALRVWFAGETAGAPPRSFAPRQLPEHEDGWALTVHKAQGSEYDDVLLVLPPDQAHPLLRRELLYTGATRARRSLEIWAGEAALRTAITQRSARSSGLLGRLRDPSV